MAWSYNSSKGLSLVLGKNKDLRRVLGKNKGLNMFASLKIESVFFIYLFGEFNLNFRFRYGNQNKSE